MTPVAGYRFGNFTLLHELGPNLERWQELRRQAASEQDPKRLMELTAEIIRLLDEKEKRLLAKRKQDDLNNSEPTDGAA